MREEFEKWYKAKIDESATFEISAGCYIDFDTASSWHGYSAATEASDAKWQAKGEGTTGYKYKSELYEEMWNKARSMGFPNVITSLESIIALQARVKGLEKALRPFVSEANDYVSNGNAELIARVKRGEKALSTTSPDQALQRVILDARIDECVMWADWFESAPVLNAFDYRDMFLRNVEELRKQLEEIGG